MAIMTRNGLIPHLLLPGEAGSDDLAASRMDLLAPMLGDAGEGR